MTISGSVFALVGGIIAVGETISGAIALIAGIGGFTAAIMIFFTAIIIPVINNQMLEEVYWGLGFGLLISGIIVFNPSGYLTKVGKILGTALLGKIVPYKIDDIFTSLLGWAEAYMPSTMMQSTVSLISGVIASVAGAATLVVETNPVYSRVAQLTLGILCLGLSMLFLAKAFVGY
jgi:hypothetical protein